MPKDSEVLFIHSESAEEETPQNLQVINKVGAKLIADHHEKASELKNQLMQQINAAEKSLARLKASENELVGRIEAFDKSVKASTIANNDTAILVVTELSGQQQEIRNEKYRLESEIVKMESDLKLIQETKILPITRSVEPISIDKAVLIIASALVGLMAALLAVLGWDVIEKMKDSSATTP